MFKWLIHNVTPHVLLTVWWAVFGIGCPYSLQWAFMSMLSALAQPHKELYLSDASLPRAWCHLGRGFQREQGQSLLFNKPHNAAWLTVERTKWSFTVKWMFKWREEKEKWFRDRHIQWLHREKNRKKTGCFLLGSHKTHSQTKRHLTSALHFSKLAALWNHLELHMEIYQSFTGFQMFAILKFTDKVAEAF